jgi:hypothetical protein
MEREPTELEGDTAKHDLAATVCLVESSALGSSRASDGLYDQRNEILGSQNQHLKFETVVEIDIQMCRR